MKDVSSYKKKFYLLCEECNNMSIEEAELTFKYNKIPKGFNSGFTNYFYCDHCKKETLHFDIETRIAKSVQLLRMNGYETMFSCEGHTLDERDEIYWPYIAFKKKPISYNIFTDILKNYGWKMMDVPKSNLLYNNKFLVGLYLIEKPKEYTNEMRDKDCENLYNALYEYFKEIIGGNINGCDN